MLTVKNISKSFNYKPVLKNIHFSLFSGETIALMGKNGAGKSTLLRILAKISAPEEGQAIFNGNDILNGVAAFRKGIYFCGHSPGLYPSITAGENLHYFSTFHGSKTSSEKINSTLQDFDLTTALNKPVKVYSQGMLQRLKLAILELIDWSLLLIDEPFSCLDLTGQEFVLKKMHEWQNGKRSIIFVDHDIDRVMNLSTRVLILDKQSIVLDEQIAAPELRQKITNMLN